MHIIIILKIMYCNNINFEYFYRRHFRLTTNNVVIIMSFIYSYINNNTKTMWLDFSYIFLTYKVKFII